MYNICHLNYTRQNYNNLLMTYEQKDMNKKIESLYKINSMLPKSLQLKKIPSLLTDDYIDNLLYRLEQNLLLQSNNSASKGIKCGSTL